MRTLEATYVLPLKADHPWGEELTSYLSELAGLVEVIVVDGSAPEVFAAHAATWPDGVRHVAPDPGHRCANGKVSGVLTGLDLASHDRVVIADDDVRYDPDALRRVVDLLATCDLVRPQNYFATLPWHAAWDTGRTLLNRAVSRDFPGTLGVRRELLKRTNGYDGDVMFENFELLRTVDVAGGRSCAPLDLYVRRLPPTTRHFWGQRVRQAYDELARPYRMAAELSVLPLVVAAVTSRRWGRLGAGIGAVMLTAEVGRRRGGGVAVFPARTVLGAPAWVAERAICSWIALGNRLVRGGIPYAGGTVARAANSRRELRRRLGSNRGNRLH